MFIRAIVYSVYVALICLAADAVSDTFREAVAFVLVMLILSGMVWAAHRINTPPPPIMRDDEPPRRRKRDRP
jgi:uncharacterized membrane protein YfbV (UPF0208 family)